MPDDVKLACADLLFSDVVRILAERDGVSDGQARDRLISTGAYDALYDLETYLWGSGPDYILAFHDELENPCA